MVIEIGLQYTNKTLSFALPLLRAYGTEFVDKLSSIFKLGVGIGDDTIKDKYIKERPLFILINNHFQPEKFEVFLDYIKSHSSYITHYSYNVEFYQTTMFVLRTPETYKDAYDAFIRGEYSKMMEDDEEISLFYDKTTIANICKRSELHKTAFIKQLNKDFNTKISDLDIEDYQVEYPLKSREEIFNCDPNRPKFYKPLITV